MDEKHYINLSREEQEYYKWVRERKNQILSWTNPQKKQAAWRELFPATTHDDSYLLGGIY